VSGRVDGRIGAESSMEHRSSVVFRGDARRALDFASGVLAAEGFAVERHAVDELAASLRTRVRLAGVVETRVVLRVAAGELALELRLLGVDELQRSVTKLVLWIALALFVLQGAVLTLAFKPMARIPAISMAAAFVLFFVVLWFFFGPRIFRSFERRVRGALDGLLGESAAAGERN
jgi:hypothetical protein